MKMTCLLLCTLFCLCLNAKSGQFQFGYTETLASGWVPPATWKLAYDAPVLQGEAYCQIDTKFKPLSSVRFSVWTQNGLEGGMFSPPAGEVDLVVALTGPTWKGFRTVFETRFVDVGGPNGEKVGNWGDKDAFRFRFRLDYPIQLGKDNSLTPALTYFHIRPVTYRPRVSGDSVSLQLIDEWRIYPWLKLTMNVGVLHDQGINGWIPADVASYGGSIGFRVIKKVPECWISFGIQQYDTLNHPSNRPDLNFNLMSTSLSLKF